MRRYWAETFILLLLTLTGGAGYCDETPPAQSNDHPHIAVHLDQTPLGPTDIDFVFVNQEEAAQQADVLSKNGIEVYETTQIELGEFHWVPSADERASRLQNVASGSLQLKENYINRIKGQLKVAYVAPDAADKKSAIILTTIRGVTTALIWYPLHDVSFEVATAVTAWLSAWTYVFGRWHKTADNLYGLGLSPAKGKTHKAWNVVVFAFRMFVLDLAISLGTNEIGVDGKGHERRAGAQVLTDAVLFNTTNNLFNATRAMALSERPDLKLAYSLFYKPLLGVMRGFQDTMGAAAPFVVSIMGAPYQVTWMLLGTTAMYVGMGTLNLAAPKAVVHGMEWYGKPGLKMMMQSVEGRLNNTRSILGSALSLARYSICNMLLAKPFSQ